jgi:cytochrome b subunit of formate dehydrogenase
MREVSQIEVYEALKGKIGEQEAKLLIEYIELKKKEVATKEDIMRLEEIIKMVEKSTKEDIQRLEEFVKEELQRIEKSTKEDIQRAEKSTKEDIQRLEEIVRELEKSTKEDIQRLEQFVKEEIRRLEKRVEKVENEIGDLKKEQRRNLYWILGVYITLWATTIAGIITLFLRIKS